MTDISVLDLRTEIEAVHRRAEPIVDPDAERRRTRKRRPDQREPVSGMGLQVLDRRVDEKRLVLRELALVVPTSCPPS